MKKYLIIFGIILLLGLGSLLGLKYYLNKNLDNTNWVVTGWSVSSLDPTKVEITLNFENNKIGGNGGVNSYGADYKLSLNNEITFSDISANEMASIDPEINAIEAMYFTLLPQTKYYKLNNNTLKLLDENKNEIIIFEKK